MKINSQEEYTAAYDALCESKGDPGFEMKTETMEERKYRLWKNHEEDLKAGTVQWWLIGVPSTVYGGPPISDEEAARRESERPLRNFPEDEGREELERMGAVRFRGIDIDTLQVDPKRFSIKHPDFTMPEK